VIADDKRIVSGAGKYTRIRRGGKKKKKKRKSYV